MTTIALPTATDTDHFGESLALAVLNAHDAILTSGLNIRLEGNLGAGKTSTVRAMLRRLGVTGRIKSPTFTLLETYPLDNGLEAFHFDFYRFEDPEEFLDAGFRENFAPGNVTLVEWSEKAYPCLPEADITVTLSVAGDGREAKLEGNSALGQHIVSEVLKQWP